MKVSTTVTLLLESVELMCEKARLQQSRLWSKLLSYKVNESQGFFTCDLGSTWSGPNLFLPVNARHMKDVATPQLLIPDPNSCTENISCMGYIQEGSTCTSKGIITHHIKEIKQHIKYSCLYAAKTPIDVSCNTRIKLSSYITRLYKCFLFEI